MKVRIMASRNPHQAYHTVQATIEEAYFIRKRDKDRLYQSHHHFKM
ncbi:hypothetical protein [Paenibacillus shirakamiensis]|nr:hypothetical protein [Paenibacillus shirakamiensis]